ncbi:MAG TPA: mycothiol system anti-sigma-R factor [Marmoricola sp.]|nr:mycothiol system anti-sigma-R factor [Marmoricola sp.]
MTTGGPVDEPVDDLTQALSSDSSPHRGHPTDCSEVLGRVFFFLDNELEQADCAEIQHHLDECGPCLARYNLERTVKSLVARSCTEVAPEGLRQRVLLSLHQVQVEITRHD